MKNIQTSALPKGKWRPTLSFWIMAGISLFLVFICALVGNIGVGLLFFAVLAMLTALYSLLFKRRSWVGLPHRKAAGIAVVGSFALFIIGCVVTALIGPSATVAASTPLSLESSVTSSATTTTSAKASPTATATATSPALTKCDTVDASKIYQEKVFICTANTAGVLVWMDKESSTKAMADKKLADDKAAADKAAAAKAASDKAAADQAAAEQAAAVKAAADQAAADQAAANKLAADQAAVQPAAPPAAAYYQNCAAAKAAGAAPLYAGQPGYRPGLDGDHDGIACER